MKNKDVFAEGCRVSSARGFLGFKNDIKDIVLRREHKTRIEGIIASIQQWHNKNGF